MTTAESDITDVVVYWLILNSGQVFVSTDLASVSSCAIADGFQNRAVPSRMALARFVQRECSIDRRGSSAIGRHNHERPGGFNAAFYWALAFTRHKLIVFTTSRELSHYVVFS